MDDERKAEGVARSHGGWLWLLGLGLTAAAFYWAVPAGHGRPTSVTVFGVTAPEALAATYPGLRPPAPAQSQMAAADPLH